MQSPTANLGAFVGLADASARSYLEFESGSWGHPPISRPASARTGFFLPSDRTHATGRVAPVEHRVIFGFNGSVNCGQREANATTRTTGCSLSGRSTNRPTPLGVNSGQLFRTYSLSGLDCRTETSQCNPDRLAHSENIRWSSRECPVNRRQATSTPRRVMHSGSISVTLGSGETEQTRLNLSRDGQGKRSLSPEKQFPSSTGTDLYSP